MVLGCRGGGSLVKCPVRKTALVLELLVNFLLPWVCYRMAFPAMGETGALFVSAVPPMIWSLCVVVGFKRLDVVSLLVICGILLSLLAMAFGGSPRLLLLRESLITGFVGFALLVSLLLPRPLMYYLAQSTTARHSPEESANFGTLWDKLGFVRCMYVTSWVWGTSLIFETVLRSILAWTIPIDQFLIISPIIGYGIYFALIGWTFWFVRSLKAAARKIEMNS